MTPPDALPDDAGARQRASAAAGSFLLQAPAGSGKTTVLVARFLALLAEVAEPEEILAVTFTRKAAGEMAARILDALAKAAADPASVDAHYRNEAVAALANAARRGWALLENPSRLRIQTLDALNHWLASQLPVTAGSGGALQVQPEAGPLYELAARRCLQSAAGDGGELGAAGELLFVRLDNNWQQLEKLLAEMLKQRAQWLPHVLAAEDPGLVPRVESALAALTRSQLRRARALMGGAQRVEAEALAQRALRNLQAAGVELPRDWPAWMVDAATGAGLGSGMGEEAGDLQRWRCWASVVLTAEGEWRKAFNKNQGFPPQDKDAKQRVADWVIAAQRSAALREALDELRQWPDATLGADDVEGIDALSHMLRHAVAELQLVFAERGVVDYTYVAGAARAALSEQGLPTELALRCGGALRHVLVDEFQDTSNDQFQLLAMLCAGWEAGDGRTLFVVGDPMQSIYQFRAAEVGLFLRARDRGIGGVALHALALNRNFRSTPAVVDWINTRFMGLFPALEDQRRGAVVYAPSQSPRQAAATATGAADYADAAAAGVAAEAAEAEDPADAPRVAVQVHAWDDTLSPAAAAAAEAAEVVRIVRDARALQPNCTIAVLFASRRRAPPIAAALQAAGLGVRGIKMEPLHERAVVRDLLGLARVLQHPADRAAWLSVLSAPWCGLGLAGIEALFHAAQVDAAKDGADVGVWGALQRHDAPELLRVAAALRPALEGDERGEPLWLRTRHCWYRLGGPACCQDERDLRDAADFIAAIAADAESSLRVGEALTHRIDEIYSRPNAEPGAIEMLTVHGAKGLEWDVVLLAGLGARPRGDTEPLLNWIDLPGDTDESELLLAPIARELGVKVKGGVGGLIRRLRSERLRLEQVRLWYVATTRARSALHLLGQVQLGDEGPAPRAGSPLAVLWPALEQDFLAALNPGGAAHETDAATGAAEKGDAAAAANQDVAAHSARASHSAAPTHFWALASDWQFSDAQPMAEVARVESASVDVTLRPEYSWVGATARAVGTIVHAELQRYSVSAPEDVHQSAQRDARQDAQRGACDYALWLAGMGVPAAEHAAAGARIRQALQAALADERGRWLLQAHASAASELRLSGVVNGRVEHIVVDRTFIDANGERWIVDYKTSLHEGGAREEFLASEVERYRPQLARYAALLRRYGPEPIRAALYFPLMQEWREVSLDDGPGAS